MQNQADILHGKKVLLTGATGFVGLPLVARLLEFGAEITVYSRRPNVARSLWGDKVKVISDFLHLDSAGYFALINLAGAPIMGQRWSRARRDTLWQSRVAFTSTVLEYVRNLSVAPEVVVSGSAIGYYGTRTQDPVDEQSPGGEGFAAELCAEWEQVAQGFRVQGSRLCLLRTAIVLGPDGGALAQMLPAFRMGVGGPLGGGQQWMSWIHRDDLVQMILWLLRDSSVSGPVNAAAPKAIRNRDFSRTLASQLNRPCFMRMPAPILKLIWGQAGEELLLGSSNVCPAKALNRRFKYQYPELPEALKNCVKN